MKISTSVLILVLEIKQEKEQDIQVLTNKCNFVGYSSYQMSRQGHHYTTYEAH